MAEARQLSSDPFDIPFDRDWDLADPMMFTDRWLGEEFVREICQGTYCWSGKFRWMRWDGQVWRTCSDAHVHERIGRWARDKVVDLHCRGTRWGPVFDGWVSVLSTRRIRAVFAEAKGLALDESVVPEDASAHAFRRRRG